MLNDRRLTVALATLSPPLPITTKSASSWTFLRARPRPQISPSKCFLLLQFPILFSRSPLDDGFIARAGLTDAIHDPYILRDTYLTRNWDLLHGGGAHTFEHHDAAGHATTVRTENGLKMWGIIRPKGYTEAETRKELDSLNRLLIREGFKELPESWELPWVAKGGQVFAIPAGPRDLM